MNLLGGIIKGGKISATTDPDNISNSCIYSIQGRQIIQGAESYGLLITVANTVADTAYSLLQVFFSASEGKLNYRMMENGSWKVWKQI